MTRRVVVTGLGIVSSLGNNKKEVRTLLEMTYESIKKANKGPLYLHCWNGWHQSGYISALLLTNSGHVVPVSTSGKSTLILIPSLISVVSNILILFFFLFNLKSFGLFKKL